MAIVLTDETALAFWRHSGTTGSTLFSAKPCRMARVPSKVAPAAEIAAACEQLCLGEDIHVLVAGKQGFRHSNAITFSSFSGALPEKSLYRLDNDMYVASPEFAFTRLASKMELVPLIKLGYELTGSYAPNADDARGFSKCPPLTSTKDLSCFIEREEGLRIRGTNKARQALRHILNGSASPMETELAMMLTLPKRLGGYGLPKPLLNYSLDTNGTRGNQLRRKKIIVDAAWPKKRLALEYDSNQFHAGAEKIIADSERRNDIAFLGYEVKTITSKEIASNTSMDRIADSIRRKLGVRARKSPDDFPTRQSSLRRKLLSTRAGTSHAPANSPFDPC